MASEEQQIELRNLVNNLCINAQSAYNASVVSQNDLLFNKDRIKETINKGTEQINLAQSINGLGQKWKK